MSNLISVALFVVGYLVIVMEQKLYVSKAASSIVLAVSLWTLAVFSIPLNSLNEHITQTGSDIFGLVMFLLATMTLIEILVHYHAFDIVEHWLRRMKVSLFSLAWLLTGLAYVGSMFIANLAITIVVIQIARRLFPKELLVPIAIAVIIASNTGGSTSPIGDVNTIMLWFAHKFTALQLFSHGLLPSALGTAAAAAILFRKFPRTVFAEASDETVVFTPSRSDKAIIVATLLAFFVPLVASAFQVPAYMGLLLGLAIVWIMIDFAKKARPQETHLQASIQKFMQHTDIESIQFFVGILLAVAALNAIGVLHSLTDMFFGAVPSSMRIIEAFIGIGVASAFIDNVPLTAAAITTLPNIATSFWVLLALTVTTGGSLFIVGSASGVVAMGMVKELTFGTYAKRGSIAALAAFVVAIGVWAIQNALFPL